MNDIFDDMQVTLLDVMGDDLTVVNAARVSHGKVKSEFDDKDARLLRYLANHEHWTPFAHPHLSFRIKAPVFVARQLMRSTVGLAANEVSRRYVDAPPTYYLPDARTRVKDVKQGSGDDVIDGAQEIIRRATIEADYTYNALLSMNVSPEIARAILPLNMMTEWVWTGSLAAFIRVCKLRMDSHAQRESQFIAGEIFKALKEKFPYSMAVYE